MARSALIYYQTQLAGYLRETDAGYEYIYNRAYLNAAGAKPISLTLPLREDAYQSSVLFPFFDGLIPEGWLLDVGRNYWKLDPRDRYELLLNLCRDTIGAVSVVPEEEVDHG